MKHLVILGAGTGGTIVANRATRQLGRDWDVTLVDREPDHLYQPGLLFLPFGIYDESQLFRPRRTTLRSGVTWRKTDAKRVDTQERLVHLDDGESIPYDLLVLATGTRIRPEETEGLTDERVWQKSVFDFYTFEGARALRDALAKFDEGRVVVNFVDLPIKCPVAPLEFVFLAQDFFAKRGAGKRVELVYATPLDSPFTKPVCSKVLGSLLTDRGIQVETDFNTASVDPVTKSLVSWDERRIDFDLLVTVPLHGGAPVILESGLGNDAGFIPTDKYSLVTKADEHIFALGDATDLPASKAGSVAHFQSEILVENLVRASKGKSLEPGFDGHANCFVETGRNRALLIDFNYDVEPLPGQFPIPHLGPMTLLGESVINHFGKLAFRWIYWNALLPGHSLPVSTRMSMRGKTRPVLAQPTIA
jgi:sulfide:quinone oxidoreductase